MKATAKNTLKRGCACSSLSSKAHVLRQMACLTRRKQGRARGVDESTARECTSSNPAYVQRWSTPRQSASLSVQTRRSLSSRMGGGPCRLHLWFGVTKPFVESATARSTLCPGSSRLFLLDFIRYTIWVPEHGVHTQIAASCGNMAIYQL